MQIGRQFAGTWEWVRLHALPDEFKPESVITAGSDGVAVTELTNGGQIVTADRETRLLVRNERARAVYHDNSDRATRILQTQSHQPRGNAYE